MKVKKTAREHRNRAEPGVTAPAMPQHLTPNAILLCDEGDSNKGGGQQGGQERGSKRCWPIQIPTSVRGVPPYSPGRKKT
jgi:hypothetical protein